MAQQIRAEVAAYAKHIIESRKREGTSLRALAREFGCSHVTLGNIVNKKVRLGPEVEPMFANALHGGSIDALRSAATLFVRAHPEALQMHDDEESLTWDVLAREVASTTASIGMV